ncbi:hypothetical protein [Streptomyces sp. NPDC088915]|uniref:hypothetical protein n=1 Tax=Streptomyces sp. NPDC088915 TaxID=3365912 RepID=UPI00381F9245
MPDTTSGLINDLDALTSAPPPRKGPLCTVALILDTLDEPAAAKLREVLDSPASAPQVADALTRNGHPVQAPAVARHRRRSTSSGCRCPR